MDRERFILPECLRGFGGTGVLDTAEKVRDAGREYLAVVEPAVRDLDYTWRRAMENYLKNPVRLSA